MLFYIKLEQRKSSEDTRGSESQLRKVLPPNLSVLSEFCPPTCIAFQELMCPLATATRQSSQWMSLKHHRRLWSTLNIKEQDKPRDRAIVPLLLRTERGMMKGGRENRRKESWGGEHSERWQFISDKHTEESHRLSRSRLTCAVTFRVHCSLFTTSFWITLGHNVRCTWHWVVCSTLLYGCWDVPSSCLGAAGW